jgi:uncharacterized OB-fold protein
VVDLDVANLRMVGQVRDIAAAAVKIGLRVQVRFEAAEEIGIPYFVAV